jgi:hypothetical protein
MHTDEKGANMLSPFLQYRHKKTGGIYRIIERGKLEATLEEVVIYTRASGGDTVWVRPLSEWLDGRYEVNRK